MENKMHQTNTVDLTPTWEHVLPVLIRLSTDRKIPMKSRRLALDELTRMAVLADEYVNLQKQGNK